MFKNIALGLVALALSACAPSAASVGTAIALTQTASVPTVTATTKPTETPLATSTLAPSSTPLPSNTPLPTNTPRATFTPKPTDTLPPPTGTPAPVKVSGKGDSVVDAEDPYQFAIVHIIGNKSSRFFAVTNYGSDGQQIDLLVNTADPYDGVRLIDIRNDSHTTRFQVKAVGDWSIEILPISEAKALSVPGTITSNGDDVFVIYDNKPNTAKIKGNSESRFFAVSAYGQRSDLLVNTADPYEGTVIVDSSVRIFDVRAVGDWSIEITS